VLLLAPDGKIDTALLNFGNSKRLPIFCLMRENKIHGFTWADWDWIGLMISKILRIRTGSDSISADQDSTLTEKLHSSLISDQSLNRSRILTFQ